MHHATFDTPEVSLHYVQQGSGPDIVWCPGGDQIGEEWAEQFDLFPDFRCTSFDPRGAGKTISHKPPPWPIATYADDLAALIREVCKPPVVVVGLSMGALIVQDMILSHPDLVRFGVAMGTSGSKAGFIHEWEGAEIRFREAGGTLPPDFALAHYALLMYPSEVLGDDALWEKCKPVVAAAYAERDGEMLAAQWQACLDYDGKDRLPGATRPLHVIGFEQDMQTPPARGRLVAEAVPDGHFHLLPGMGHCSLFRHKPEAVADKIHEIIASHG
ncbi:MAG: alpha/beta hydrolase [Rhodospirillaceae bacterium]|jgi:3-oxoadipate enol-lactonase|nr:alpha/beta hydrolase [Rhodospirillaceae bacterium]MBT7613698.1 alpha/beta hydrolase [Rhodospirillaceae bacterium]